MDAIARRLARLDSCAVSDALDSLSLPGAALGLQALSAPRLIAGRVITIDLVEAGARPVTESGGTGSTAVSRRHLGTAAVDAASPGDVIVVAHHARTDAAGWGGVLSAGAVTKGIAGVIVDGAVRDIDQAAGYGLPVYAAAAVPRTARGRVAERDWNVPVTIAGVPVQPGDYVIADGSGVVFVPLEHAEAVLAKAEAITRAEELMAARALAGAPMTDVMSGHYESMLGDGGSDGPQANRRSLSLFVPKLFRLLPLSLTSRELANNCDGMGPSARPRRLWVSGSRLAVVVATASALALAGCSQGTTSGGTTSRGALAGQPAPGWVTAWGASQVAGGAVIQGLNCPSGAGLANQTVRNVVFLSAGGDEVRVRLSNAFGPRPITISHATVAQAGSAAGGAVVPGSIRDLAFGGRRQVTLAPGTDALSDPVQLGVTALRDLLVSAYVPGATGPITNHPFAGQDNYLAPGDRTAATSGAPYTQMQCWMLVSGVQVPAGARYAGTVVAVGDSITDGFELNGSADDNRRWPDDLARRLAAEPGRTLSVVNAGLVGNELREPVPGDPQYGIPAVDRLDRDVFGQAGVRAVILLEGVNDIAYGATADQVIAADERIIAQAHARGLRIFGATLTPFGGAIFDRPAVEAARTAINKWIMTSHSLDGVIDFSQAVASKASPLALSPAFDSGDHTHPSEAGYQAMANAINVQALLAA